jgi:hypothetical protein
VAAAFVPPDEDDEVLDGVDEDDEDDDEDVDDVEVDDESLDVDGASDFLGVSAPAAGFSALVSPPRESLR